MLSKLIQFNKAWLLSLLVLQAIVLPDCNYYSNQNNQSKIQWSKEWNKLKDSLQQFDSDFEKTTYLRKFCARLFDVGILDAKTQAFYRNISFDSMKLDLIYSLSQADSIPADCGITSYFYIKLAESFGYKSYQYSFGFTDSPYEYYIHSFPIIIIQYNGRERMIIQDPYLDLTFKDSKGDPIDFYDFLRLLKNKKYTQIYNDEDSSSTNLIITDTLRYLSHLSDSCRLLLRKLLFSANGQIAKKIPFIRSYNKLMRSPCNNFELGFEQALIAHHFYEPFLFAYTLRVNSMTGSSDAKLIQSGIDSLLRDTIIN